MKIKSGNPFFTKSWTGNFLSNVLGVIVGIAITFGVSSLIQRHDERKQIRQMLTLIREEVVINKQGLENMNEDFLQTKKIYGLFLSSAWKTMPEDTLDQYLYHARKVSAYGLQSATWNIFQNSDVIKSFDNKELIIFLSLFYKMTTKSEELWTNYAQEKSQMFNAYVSDKSISSIYDYVDLVMIKDKPSFLFMDNVYRLRTYDFVFNYTIDYADYILYLIDRIGDYQYKFNKYEDFEEFRKRKNK